MRTFILLWVQIRHPYNLGTYKLKTKQICVLLEGCIYTLQQSAAGILRKLGLQPHAIIVSAHCRHGTGGRDLKPQPVSYQLNVFPKVRKIVSDTSPVSMAWASLVFHCSATSFASGSSGLGALNKAWIDSRTVRICKAGDHLSRETFIAVWNTTFTVYRKKKTQVFLSRIKG